jgi:VWFA-related protein
MFFDFEPKLMQDWTSDPKLLSAAASRTTGEARSRFGGTAIWDSTYRTCRDNIPVQTPGEETFASAIILFTDGDDNRSHALPEDVIDECQQHQTAIYPFLVDDSARRDAGQKILRSLAELTGGRVFYGQESDTNITASVLRIDTDLRDRYTVVYRPIDQKRDGKLHTIELAAPQRTAFFTTRTGYYATK